MAASLQSSSDAQSIIDEFDDLEYQLKSVNEYYEQIRRDLVKDCVRINNRPHASYDIGKILKNGYNDTPQLTSRDSFAQTLVLYEKLSASVSLCKKLSAGYSSYIDSNIEQVEKAASLIKWIFLSSKNKEKARGAFTNLVKVRDGDYGRTIKNAVKLIGNEIDKHKAVNSIKGSPSKYVSLLNDLGKDLGAPEKHPAEDVLSTIRPIIKEAEKADSSSKELIEEIKQQIIKQAEAIAAKNALQQLQEIEVEQLNKLKSGLRTKALRDAGFTDVAKVYTATVYQLASVNGISAETATQIKESAGKILSEMKESFRLKLSADDKSAETTRLIRLTCQFIHLSEKYKILEEYLKTIITPAKTAVAKLEPLTCNAVYVVSPQGKEYHEAYKFLSSLFKKLSPIVREIANIHEYTSQEARTEFVKNPIDYNTVLQDIVPTLFNTGDGQYGLPEDLAREIQDQVFFPDGLKARLARYQEWGVKYALHQGKIILGDEMGLGKTVQAIATMVSLKNTGAKRFMVICPASVLPNWCKEIEKHSVFKPTRIYGYLRKVAFQDWLKNGGVAVTTYETTSQIEFVENASFDLLVVDEAHYIKNPNAIRSKAVVGISKHADRIIFLTGTPLENKVEEMITLVDILNPKIESEIKSVAYISTAQAFRNKVAPVYYRRKRIDVLSELPDKEEFDTWVELLPEEKKLYVQSVLQKNRTAIRRVSWAIQDPSRSSKALRLKEIVEEAADADRRVIVFSFYKDTLRMLSRFLGESCIGTIDGSVPVDVRQQMIDDFENKPAGSVLLAQIYAGGTGLNIQTATVVIICEPQLKPSIEDQAISRSYRMGQARNVLVYRLLASNTIDERITDLLEEKRKAFLAFADNSVAAKKTAEIDEGIEDKTFGQLIQEEIDRINKENGKESLEEDDSFIKSTELIESSHQPDTEEPSNTSEDEQMDSLLDSLNEETTDDTAVQLSLFDQERYKKRVEKIEEDDPNAPSFDTIDAFIRYMNDEEISYVDNRSKNGCLWVLSDANLDKWFKTAKVNGQRMHYAQSAKALQNKPGWYIS